jgi:predicted DNA-binding transcriptional regulator YafY
MPRGDQVARLYKLVMALAGAKYGLPAAALARRHRWPSRTVYRDLHALELAGFPITRNGGNA